MLERGRGSGEYVMIESVHWARCPSEQMVAASSVQPKYRTCMHRVFEVPWMMATCLHSLTEHARHTKPTLGAAWPGLPTMKSGMRFMMHRRPTKTFSANASFITSSSSRGNSRAAARALNCNNSTMLRQTLTLAMQRLKRNVKSKCRPWTTSFSTSNSLATLLCTFWRMFSMALASRRMRCSMDPEERCSGR